MKNEKRRNIVKAALMLVVLCACALCISGTAEANTSSTFPWDSALKQLADSLTGPVAFSLGLFMIV
jgi:type IV secretory pathway VirB2 component (pilin)